MCNQKNHSSALLISRYILRLGQWRRCCFCAACPNRKMYLEIKSADEGAFRQVTPYVDADLQNQQKSTITVLRQRRHKAVLDSKANRIRIIYSTT